MAAVAAVFVFTFWTMFFTVFTVKHFFFSAKDPVSSSTHPNDNLRSGNGAWRVFTNASKIPGPNQPKGNCCHRVNCPAERVPSAVSSQPGSSWTAASEAPRPIARAKSPLDRTQAAASFRSMTRKPASRALPGGISASTV